MKKLHRIALTSAMAALLLSGCASFWTSTDFTPYVGDDTVYFGRGGAMEVMDGVEVWKTGLPNRKYRIIGVINAKIADGWQAHKMMMSAAASEAKDAGADAIVRQSTQFRAGTPYVPQPTQSFGGGYAGGFAGGLASGFANGIGMAQSINHLSGTYLAVKYVD